MNKPLSLGFVLQDLLIFPLPISPHCLNRLPLPGICHRGSSGRCRIFCRVSAAVSTPVPRPFLPCASGMLRIRPFLQWVLCCHSQGCLLFSKAAIHPLCCAAGKWALPLYPSYANKVTVNPQAEMCLLTRLCISTCHCQSSALRMTIMKVKVILQEILTWKKPHSRNTPGIFQQQVLRTDLKQHHHPHRSCLMTSTYSLTGRHSHEGSYTTDKEKGQWWNSNSNSKDSTYRGVRLCTELENFECGRVKR